MREMTPKELKQYLDHADEAPLLLDVREKWEFDIVHLPDSVLIPLGELDERFGELDAGRTVVSICHVGIRSRTAALMLEKQGFGDTINLKGGLTAWAKDIDTGMPTY